MAKGFKHGAGGARLNFKVVGGTTEPATPKENLIWVDTDETITGWVFSATEPEAPVEGMVWIFTGITSSASFNALKKNGIQVYPLSAKQYVIDAWVVKSAKSYQNGKWFEWIPKGAMFWNGQVITDFTGGIKGYAYRRSGSQSGVAVPEILIQNGIMKIGPIANQTAGAAFTENQINLSGFSKMTINVTERLGEAECWVGFATTKANNFSFTKYINITSPGHYEMEIPSGSTNLYGAIYFGGFTDKSISFDAWRLE